jgi:hypothetical protein
MMHESTDGGLARIAPTRSNQHGKGLCHKGFDDPIDDTGRVSHAGAQATALHQVWLIAGECHMPGARDVAW